MVFNINQNSITMKLHLAIIATQLVAGAEWFANQPVKNQDESPFALVPYRGELLKVNEGDWLVEYPDGTLEIWNTEQIQANTDYVETTEADEDVRIGDEDVNSGGETGSSIAAGDAITNPGLAEQGIKVEAVNAIPPIDAGTAHIISARDLKDNPELIDQGIKEGDMVGIPDNGLINTGSPLIQEPTTTITSDPSKTIE